MYPIRPRGAVTAELAGTVATALASTPGVHSKNLYLQSCALRGLCSSPSSHAGHLGRTAYTCMCTYYHFIRRPATVTCMASKQLHWHIALHQHYLECHAQATGGKGPHDMCLHNGMMISCNWLHRIDGTLLLHNMHAQHRACQQPQQHGLQQRRPRQKPVAKACSLHCPRNVCGTYFGITNHSLVAPGVKLQP